MLLLSMKMFLIIPAQEKQTKYRHDGRAIQKFIVPKINFIDVDTLKRK